MLFWLKFQDYFKYPLKDFCNKVLIKIERLLTLLLSLTQLKTQKKTPARFELDTAERRHRLGTIRPQDHRDSKWKF